MITLDIQQEALKKNIERCHEQGIILPTFEEMKHPEKIPQGVKDKLKEVGLWDVNPLNLFRINWHNEAVESGGTFSGVNYMEIPKEITGVNARIIALVGKWFPTGAHKVGATYGCLAPALVSGNFDSTKQKAVWPSTGNYCRGGAYNSALLDCDSIAILPEEMSQERFNWLTKVAGEVIATPGCESNVKEIFDKCHELNASRGDDIVIFNQFEEFGNYLWHHEVTGNAILQVQKELGISEITAYVSSTGSGGTIAAGDALKKAFPKMKIAAAEALQCPTLLRNGFGGHRIEGIGDKHVPWIHNVRNTDMVIAVDDKDSISLMRLFNEQAGVDYLLSQGMSKDFVPYLELMGISGIANVIASIKMAKFYEMDEQDTIFTICTDSMEMYQSRITEYRDLEGEYTRESAVASFAGSLDALGIDNMEELGYYERLRIHNLKYYTWIEQQGKELEELNRQWYDREYWEAIPAYAAKIDELINKFNKDAGVKL
ncbi:MAG: pyridoxal-phosphate dependent enzyme [Spirochaetales bacterium]|nr:pyridoxal-phosphate dependent enzyme [Spirochaetales bacterium]